MEKVRTRYIIINQTTNIFLIFEKLTIIIFALSVIILGLVNVLILMENSSMQILYSYFFMNERLNYNSFLIDVYLQPVTQPETQCRGGYIKKDFVSIESFKNINCITLQIQQRFKTQNRKQI